jgi:paired amphipathic helix protein Sin3a
MGMLNLFYSPIFLPCEKTLLCCCGFCSPQMDIWRMLIFSQNTSSRQAKTKIMSRDGTTFELGKMERKEAWKYYISSFVRVEPTEGVRRVKVRKTVLTRNMRNVNADTDSDTDSAIAVIKKPWSFDEGLILQICVNTYNLTYKAGTTDSHIFNWPKATDPRVTDRRNQRFRNNFILNSPWMKNMSHSQVEKTKGDFDLWMKEGVLPGSAPATTAPAETYEATA